MLTIVDDFTREYLAIEVNFGLNGKAVTQVFDRLFELHGKVAGIRSDNGPEFAGNEMDTWAYSNCVKLDLIRPGKPNENAFIESFNGRLREECLNDNRFLTLVEARRMDYNDERPYSSLDGLTPREFADKHTAMLNKLALEKHQLELA